MPGPDDGRRVSCFVSGYLGLQRRRVQGNRPLKTTLLRFLLSDVGQLDEDKWHTACKHTHKHTKE